MLIDSGECQFQVPGSLNHCPRSIANTASSDSLTTIVSVLPSVAPKVDASANNGQRTMPARPEPNMADTNFWPTVISAAFSPKAFNGLTEAASSWADAAHVQTDPRFTFLGDATASLPLLDHTRIGSETESTNDKGLRRQIHRWSRITAGKAHRADHLAEEG
jgi:hypothetical protein